MKVLGRGTYLESALETNWWSKSRDKVEIADFMTWYYFTRKNI